MLLPFTWSPLKDTAAAVRMHITLKEWGGTPYRLQSQTKGGGVDCVRFVTGVLDELCHINNPTDTPELPKDTALHNKATAAKALKALLQRYPGHTHIRSGTVEPGDIVVVGVEGGGPGHGMVVGPKKNTLWHSTDRSRFAGASACS